MPAVCKGGSKHRCGAFGGLSQAVTERQRVVLLIHAVLGLHFALVVEPVAEDDVEIGSGIRFVFYAERSTCVCECIEFDLSVGDAGAVVISALASALNALIVDDVIGVDS